MDSFFLEDWFEGIGEKKYRAAQVLRWLYMHNVSSFEEMTNLGKNMRQKLDSNFFINRLKRVETEKSKDGSVKYLFGLEDGCLIESVLIPEKERFTLCISSQVGCAMGCKFCMTGKSGFKRNLTQGEIVSQVRDTIFDMGESGSRLTNIVFMGMGEPLANYENVKAALTILTDFEYGFKFSNRKITISTSGIVPNLLKLGQDTKVNPAISLNAADEATRSALMPVNDKYSIKDLLQACVEYRMKKGRRITFEYILIQGVNDSIEDARKLVKLLRPLRTKVNLIPFNPHEGSEFARPSAKAVEDFHKIIVKSGLTAIVRHSKGDDISAACGQLGAKNTESQE